MNKSKGHGQGLGTQVVVPVLLSHCITLSNLICFCLLPVDKFYPD